MALVMRFAVIPFNFLSPAGRPGRSGCFLVHHHVHCVRRAARAKQRRTSVRNTAGVRRELHFWQLQSARTKVGFNSRVAVCERSAAAPP